MTVRSYVSLDTVLAHPVTTDSAFLLAEYLKAQAGFSSFGTRASASRHFLYWLLRHHLPLSQVDAAVVERFAHHRCRCIGYAGVCYSQRQLQRPGYITNVRRFVSFLEDRGTIRIPEDLAPIVLRLPAYGNHLGTLGYSRGTRSMLLSGAEHFVHWLRWSRIPARDADDFDIERFAKHDCRCFLCRKHGVLTNSGVIRRRRAGALFLQYLRGCNLVPQGMVTEDDPRLDAFRAWLTHQCGVTAQTVVRYLAEVARWLPAPPQDLGTSDAITIRNIVLHQPSTRSHKSVQLTATVLRTYLRYLVASDACRPELVSAVPCPRRPRNVALPRFLSSAIIQQIIASCDIDTPGGLRDRAILLLLARLGLRAGDVCQLGLTDIDWRNGRLRVDGKSRRASRLPLPQDVGDALLAYIEYGRPPAREDHVFLRVSAPFKSLQSSTIAALVAKARLRAGIEGVPTGSHVFRHSLATSMLRAGCSLEQVGAILRHRSPDTTAIYAKTDIDMLARVAQPWPGDSSC
jgi:site-specific recombinase XerD